MTLVWPSTTKYQGAGPHGRATAANSGFHQVNALFTSLAKLNKTPCAESYSVLVVLTKSSKQSSSKFRVFFGQNDIFEILTL